MDCVDADWHCWLCECLEVEPVCIDQEFCRLRHCQREFWLLVFSEVCVESVVFRSSCEIELHGVVWVSVFEECILFDLLSN